jgi:hypothetical protein
MTHTCSTIEVKLDGQIRLRLENVGYLSHEFLLCSFANNTKHKIEVETHSEITAGEWTRRKQTSSCGASP